MIYKIITKDNIILGAVDTKRIMGFVYDGTSPEYAHRYVLKLEYGHTMVISAADMQHILAAMEVGK